MPLKKDKPRNISEYISSAPPSARERLVEILECLRKAAPKAEESLKWGNPAFTQKRVLFAFAAYKDHINFYPTPAVVEAFKIELMDFKTTKGGIQLPLDKPIPISLIHKIAIYRLNDVIEKDAKWM
jgi:uncharacterized protein YdhG (YjbR/CyaY superfamily)